MTPIEKVARALLRRRFPKSASLVPDERSSSPHDRTVAEAIADARVAIEALRKPSHKMVNAAAMAVVDSDSDSLFEVIRHDFMIGWVAAIDALLSEEASDGQPDTTSSEGPP